MNDEDAPERENVEREFPGASFTDKLKVVHARFSSLAFPLRLLAWLSASGLASFSISVLFEWASFLYAINYGFRVPFEGIPYLKSVVGAFSFVFVLTLGSLIAGLYSFNRYLKGKLKEYSDNIGLDLAEGLSNLSLWKRILSITFAIFIPGFLSTEYLASLFGRAFADLFFLLLLYMLLVLHFPSKKLVITLCAVLLPVLIFIGALYDSQAYGAMLRNLGYGGGLPVKIEVDTGSEKMEISCHLMLRTTESYMVFLPDKRTREIPSTRVISIEHSAAPLSSLPTQMPEEAAHIRRLMLRWILSVAERPRAGVTKAQDNEL